MIDKKYKKRSEGKGTTMTGVKNRVDTETYKNHV